MLSMESRSEPSPESPERVCGLMALVVGCFSACSGRPRTSLSTSTPPCSIACCSVPSMFTHSLTSAVKRVAPKRKTVGSQHRLWLGLKEAGETCYSSKSTAPRGKDLGRRVIRTRWQAGGEEPECRYSSRPMTPAGGGHERNKLSSPPFVPPATRRPVKRVPWMRIRRFVLVQPHVSRIVLRCRHDQSRLPSSGAEEVLQCS